MTRAQLLREDCRIVENRLHALAVMAKQTGLTEDEATERETLQRMHTVLVSEVIADAFSKGAQS